MQKVKKQKIYFIEVCTVLHKLQTSFVSTIYQSTDASTGDDFPGTIQNRHGLSAAEQLAIYRNSHFGGLTNALAETYPAIRLLVGEQFFDAMAWRYIKSHPSQHYDLNQYGQSLAGFIENFRPADALSYLADVARLEWGWHQAFYAAEHKPITETDLRQLAPDQHRQLSLYLPDSAQLLSSPYPVHKIWDVAQNDTDSNVDLDEGGAKLLIWRDDDTRRIDLLTEVQWQFLNSIQPGIYFGDLCVALVATNPSINLAQLLHSALQQRWLAHKQN